jgi:hypothetical protein
MMEVAQDLAERGFHVIPLNGKKSLIKWEEFQRRAPSEDEVAQWWAQWPNANVGIITGITHVVLDADTPQAEEFLASGAVTRTPWRVKTPRGKHFYYRVNPSLQMTNSAGNGLDSRGLGGYVVAAGSAGYFWEVDMAYGATDVGDLPVLTGKDISAVNAFRANKAQPTDATGELQGEVLAHLGAVHTPHDGAPVQVGGRNNALASLVGQWVSQGMVLSDILAHARIWNQTNTPPMADAEVIQTVTSIVIGHQKRHGEVVPLSPAGSPDELLAPDQHPLAQFIEIDAQVCAPRWIIPGFICHGVTVISGSQGVGKTTALLPLAMVAAGLTNNELAPKRWRHVVYVTEDVDQAQRILAGVVNYSNLGAKLDGVRERIHLVAAKRLSPTFVAQVGKLYRDRFTREVDSVQVQPLVVLDTKSAVLDVESENDNSEASRMMAALKQGFEGLPVWLIGHVAKASMDRADVLSSRGASAIEGDAHQTMYLVKEGDTRFLINGKTRFEPHWRELEIHSNTAETQVRDEFGDMEHVVLRWGVAGVPTKTRQEAAEQAKVEKQDMAEAGTKQEIIDVVHKAWEAGVPLSKRSVASATKKKTQVVYDLIAGLIEEGYLAEIEVPSQIRINNSRPAFLVALDAQEREAGKPSKEKRTIPPSWGKVV